MATFVHRSWSVTDRPLLCPPREHAVPLAVALRHSLLTAVVVYLLVLTVACGSSTSTSVSAPSNSTTA